MSQEVICNYQVNLENATNLSSSLLGVGDIQYFWKGGRTLYRRTWYFIGGLDNHLETTLNYLTLIS